MSADIFVALAIFLTHRGFDLTPREHEKIAVWVIGVLGAWLVALSITIFNLSGDIKALKQNRKDHGEEIVRSLHLKDSTARDVALIDVAADARKAVVEERPLRPEKLTPVIAAVEHLTDSPESTEQAWSAAAALVTYRSLALTNFMPVEPHPCFTEAANYTPHPKVGATKVADFIFENCTIVLDDVDTYERSIYAHNFRTEVADGSSDKLRLLLSRVRVVYHGGPMFRFDEMICQECTFVFDTPLPQAHERSVVRQLLAMSSNDITIVGTPI